MDGGGVQAEVVETDVGASNGVIHSINRVGGSLLIVTIVVVLIILITFFSEIIALSMILDKV